MGPYEPDFTVEDTYAPVILKKKPQIPGLKKSYTENSSGTEKSFTKKGGGTQLIPRDVNPNAIAKTAISAGTALGSLGFINKTAKLQKNRNMRMLTPIQTSVAPEQDLPAEVLAQRQGQISRLRSTYAGSDPSMKLISDLSTGAQRTGLREQLASERGANLIAERNRVANENAANQVRAGEIQHKNILRQQELDDYRLNADINKADHQNKLLSQVGSAAIDNIESAEAIGIRGDQVDRENSIGAIDTNLQHLTNLKEEAIKMGYDPITLTDLNNQIASLVNERNNIQTKGTYRMFRKPSVNQYLPSVNSYNSYVSQGTLLPRQ